MYEKVPNLVASQEIFKSSKENILSQWLSYKLPQEILKLHHIDKKQFHERYASGVFDYFMSIIAGKVDIGDCPVMQEFLTFLKDREISADELFEICSHFRRSMVDFSYDADLNSKELFDEISYIFDKNFRGILKYYTDTIFQKLIDARLMADRASKAKEYFLSNMSHEIRTPLNAILGFVKLMQEEDISQKHRNYLDIILNSGENLLSIINDILDFSKLRSGEFTIEPKLFSLHDEVSHTMELFVPSAGAKNITITSYIDPYIRDELYADGLRIKQILSNFLSNAIKFTPDGGHIEVEVFCSDGMLELSVRDNGMGIAKEDLDDIFTAFTQAQYSEIKNFNGTGLGLSICYQLVQHMNGTIDVKSTLGEGSKFFVILPVDADSEYRPVYDDVSEYKALKLALYTKNIKNDYKAKSFLKYANIFNMNIKVIDKLEDDFDIIIFIDEDVSKEFKLKILNSEKKFIPILSKADDRYDKYDHINSISFPLYYSKIRETFKVLLHPDSYLPHKHEIGTKFVGHILVAEDNETNQELIKIILLKYGLSFDLAPNGLKAVELYKKNSYDLILMDEQMPVMDGNEAVGKILSYEKRKGLKHTPISALTANVIKGAKERGLLSGFDSFLGKPVVLKELERVFAIYLKVDNTKELEEETQSFQSTILGLDALKLKKELMLSEDELIMLLTLFIKKMKQQVPELQNAIKIRDYKKIALNAHSIKGSSGNFRIELLQKSASEMQKMAKEENSEYNYEEVFDKMKNRLKEIKVAYSSI